MKFAKATQCWAFQGIRDQRTKDKQCLNYYLGDVKVARVWPWVVTDLMQDRMRVNIALETFTTKHYTCFF